MAEIETRVQVDISQITQIRQINQDGAETGFQPTPIYNFGF